jgi:uncharacterized protein
MKNVQNKRTMVIGASLKSWRYSHMAIHALRKHGHEVVAIGLREGVVADVPVIKDHPDLTDIHTVSMYVGKERQAGYFDYLLSIRPQRVIFNPGAENDDLEGILNNRGIEVLTACTLVMLSTNQF